MNKKISILRFTPFVLWIIIIFILLTLPPKDFSPSLLSIPHLDKLVHMALFGGLVFWFGFAFLHKNFSQNKQSILLITVLSCLYGIGMEFIQKYFTQNKRGFSYTDILADMAGAILAFVFVKWMLKKYQTLKLAKKND